MLATQSRLLNASRPSTRPFVASSSSVARAPTVATNAAVKLAPLIDSLKADQLKDNLPQVGHKQQQQEGWQQQHLVNGLKLCADTRCCGTETQGLVSRNVWGGHLGATWHSRAALASLPAAAPLMAAAKESESHQATGQLL